MPASIGPSIPTARQPGESVPIPPLLGVEKAESPSRLTFAEIPPTEVRISAWIWARLSASE